MEKKINKAYTLLFLFNGIERTQILLGYKKRGFGEGKWNGFGGKVDPQDASISDAALREMLEESGARILDKPEFVGLLTFDMDNDATKFFEVHVFTAEQAEKEDIAESEEMRPEWYDVNSIPYAQMWKDDEIWFPIMLERKLFSGEFHFLDNENIIDHKLVYWENTEENRDKLLAQQLLLGFDFKLE